MIKTKGTSAGKVGNNSPAGYTLTGTERSRVGGQMPSPNSKPTMAGYMQDAAAMPMYMVQEGYTDAGAKVGGG